MHYLILIPKKNNIKTFFVTCKVHRGEVDYQKLRDEGNWKKLIELSENGKVVINGNYF